MLVPKKYHVKRKILSELITLLCLKKIDCFLSVSDKFNFFITLFFKFSGGNLFLTEYYCSIAYQNAEAYRHLSIFFLFRILYIFTHLDRVLS